MAPASKMLLSRGLRFHVVSFLLPNNVPLAKLRSKHWVGCVAAAPARQGRFFIPNLIRSSDCPGQEKPHQSGLGLRKYDVNPHIHALRSRPRVRQPHGSGVFDLIIWLGNGPLEPFPSVENATDGRVAGLDSVDLCLLNGSAPFLGRGPSTNVFVMYELWSSNGNGANSNTTAPSDVYH